MPYATVSIERDDVCRADTYGLLAVLLAGPPAPKLLGSLSRIPGGGDTEEGPVGKAWHRLGEAARSTSPEAAAEEYHALFIGVTRGELVPYASWYRTGSLMDRPLVRLRADLARLGFARQSDMQDPEDHAAPLCEVMGALVVQDGTEVAEQQAQGFFATHLAPWLPSFFADLRLAPSARFYAPVGELGERFIELERRYLSLERPIGDNPGRIEQ